ncbi:nuclear receptor subfamily 0 group B member 1-like [Acanthaster planci]|uniref:Nuclear receptor subfamily 0 group B member 1-like n=1 Tax=Acanthaster planci TaxID=133434 RepID=A0A8B7YBS7_ACAPL|nr:nuclear receptor subfamily 0 group B member 1-like [Acanthaster planci]XP_022089835.1 nuclear receptor subfamily 0 group B member 1-like [Acanthaster planci]
MAPMQSKSTAQSTESSSTSMPLSSCDCPERMKEGSILYSLLSSSAHEPMAVDPDTASSGSNSSSAAGTAAPTERRYPTAGVASVSQVVNQALWRRGPGTLLPPTVITLKHHEVICQQAAQLLLKTVDFVRNLPSCQRLCPHDRITLFQHCWAELLVLMMTQYRFHFETEDVDFDFGVDSSGSSSGGNSGDPQTCHHCHGHTSENMLLRCLVALQGIPTQSDIHMMECFFSKCELMGLDDKEYAYLKMTILFNPDIPGLVDPAMVETLQSEAQLRLSEYVAATRPRDPLRFARVLLSLPPLRNIRSRVISQLFFRELIGGVPMEDLLEQMMTAH